MKLYLSLLGVGAVLAVAAASASANFRVTDEHTGRTFLATDYYSTPYECAAPCAFAFEAIPACSQGQGHYFIWGIRDAAEQTFYNVFNSTSWRYDFTALGNFSVWETESTSSCGTGGTFRLRVLDKTPPETSITGGPNGVTEDVTPSFEFAASEPGATFTCRFDGAAFTPCSSPITTPPLSLAEHAFEVQASDAAGNADPSPARVTFRVADLTAPTLNLRALPSQDLRTSLRRGVSFTATTNETGRVAARLLVDRKTARRLKINKNARGAVVVGSLTRDIGIGKTVVKVKLSRKARSRVKRANRVKLRIVAKLTDSAGNVRTETLPITLKRKLAL